MVYIWLNHSRKQQNLVFMLCSCHSHNSPKFSGENKTALRARRAEINSIHGTIQIRVISNYHDRGRSEKESVRGRIYFPGTIPTYATLLTGRVHTRRSRHKSRYEYVGMYVSHALFLFLSFFLLFFFPFQRFRFHQIFALN